MEETLSSIIVEDGGRILVNWSDGTGLEFTNMQALVEYASLIMSKEAIRRIIVAKLLVDNNIVTSHTEKKFILTMTGVPTLTNG